MNEELENLNNENEMINNEVQKDTLYVNNIKQEAKELTKRNEKLSAQNKVLQRAIIIKSKEVNKHKLYIKTNDMRLQGVTHHLGYVKDKVVSMNSSKVATLDNSQRNNSQYQSQIQV